MTSRSGKPHGLTMRHYLSLLFIAIFGTYYYIIVHGGFIHLDDMNLMTRLLNEPSFALKDLFFSHKIAGYYRPIIELSYRLDHFVWFDSASGWHLTNVVLHAANTGLVFLISFFLIANSTQEKEAAAFCSALLYGINPLATEAVCWVSGRSELILAFFMLSSFCFYLLFKKRGSYTYLFLSGLMYLFAAGTKETALILPVLIAAYEYLFKQGRVVKKSLIITIGYFFLLTIVYFLFFRRTGFDTSNMNVGVGTHGLRTVSIFANVLVLFASLGFYVKKLFIPYPLNFAIHSISLIFYALTSLIVLILFMMQWRFLPPAFKFFTTWVLITVSPAIAAAVLHLPWVLWAERYLYVPLAGFSTALGLWFILFKKRHAFTAVLTFGLLTGLFWATALHRTYVWADEVKLWENAALQSNYGPVYYFYGKSLLNDNRESEGITQMNKALATGFRYDPYIVLSGVALKKGDFDKSEEWLKRAIYDYPERAELHRYLAELYLHRVSRKPGSRVFLMKAINEYIKYVAVQKEDAAAHLKIAQLYKAAHQEHRAVPFLRRTIQIDSGSPFAITARKYLQENQRGKVNL